MRYRTCSNTFLGLTCGSTVGLIAFQSAALLQAMTHDAKLRVDGGTCANNLLL